MPLNLASGAQLVAAQEFQHRVAMAFYFVAREVLTEDNPETTVGYENRQRFARSIITQDYTMFMQYAAFVATDMDIVMGGPYSDPASQPGDQLIIDTIKESWSKLAGVPGA